MVESDGAEAEEQDTLVEVVVEAEAGQEDHTLATEEEEEEENFSVEAAVGIGGPGKDEAVDMSLGSGVHPNVG